MIYEIKDSHKKQESRSMHTQHLREVLNIHIGAFGAQGC